MAKRSIVVSVLILFTLALLPFMPGRASAAQQEETVVGTVVQHGKVFIIEADEGDYIVKGKDLSKMAGKMVEVTGTISESDKGDTIDVKSVEEIDE